MAHLKVAVFGFISALVAAIAAEAFRICPDLQSQWPTILVAGVSGAFGLYLKSPVKK